MKAELIHKNGNFSVWKSSNGFKTEFKMLDSECSRFEKKSTLYLHEYTSAYVYNNAVLRMEKSYTTMANDLAFEKENGI